MGVVIRQSVKTTIVIGMGAILGTIFNYVGVYVLDKQQFGFLTNFIYLAAIIQNIILVGTGSLIATYTPKYSISDKRRNVLISFCILLTLFAGVIFTIAYLALKNNVIAHYQVQDRVFMSRYYTWLPALVFIWSFSSLLELYLIGHSKAAVSSFMREVLLRVCNLAIIVLYFFNVISFDNLIIGSVLVYFIPTSILLFVAGKQNFGISFNFSVFSKTEYKELFNFSWYHLLLSISLNFIGYIDILMLGPLDKSGLASLAVYRWAILVISIMVIPYRAMQSASFATLNRAYIEKNQYKLSDFFHRAGINMLIAAFGMFLLIACNLDNLIRILPPGYGVVKPLVIILMAGRLIDMATGLNTELISISEYYKFNFRVSFFLMVMIVALDRILIPIYGVYGAAWGTTISLVLFNITKMLYLWKKMKVQPFTIHSSTVVLAGVIAGIAGYTLPYLTNPFFDTVTRSLLIGIVYSFLLIKLKPSADLNIYFQSVLKNKKLF